MKKWNVLQKSEKKLTPDSLLNLLLENRNIKTKTEKEKFLNPSFSEITKSSLKIDPKNLKKAISRIEKAIKEKEQIIVFGDYDVDGITASAIIWETLNEMGAKILPYIPSRFEEGYGLSVKGIDNLLKENKDVKLIITVDNGIVANDAVDHANKKGIDIIITDHHVASKKLPKAHSIVHTTLMCGAGVAYFLAKTIKKEKLEKEDNLLELVTLATIADLVPLTGANRILVSFGLKKLRETKRAGLLSLFRNANLAKEKIDIFEIGHVITPRLNAMGRLYSAMDS